MPPKQAHAPKTDDDAQDERQGPTTTTHGDGRHTTRPQPYEQLLVGWLVGGTTTGRGTETTTTMPAPAPTPPRTTLPSVNGAGDEGEERRRGGEGETVKGRPQKGDTC